MATSRFSDSDATRIIAALEARAERKSQDGAQISTTWGTVGAVDTWNKSASVFLYGETDSAYMSEGFRIPATGYLSVGDIVKVAINYATSDRWIEEIHVPNTEYKKVEIDISTGSIRVGDGSIPPTEIGVVPTGGVLQYAGSTPPAGYLFANGASLPRNLYPGLFDVIGTTYGSDGPSYFTLPNMTASQGIDFIIRAGLGEPLAVSADFTADAYIFGVVSTAFTADAVIVTSPSFTADAIISSTQVRTFTADAEIQTALTGSFTANAYIAAITHTGDIYLLEDASGGFALEDGSGYVINLEASTERSGSFTANAQIGAAPTVWGNWSATFSNTVATGTYSGTFTADTIISMVFGDWSITFSNTV